MDEVDAPVRPDRVLQVQGGAPGDGTGSFADRWPFRRKLNVLVGVPLVVILLLLAYVTAGLSGQARHAASAARLVRDSRQVAELVDRVETEHQQALLLSVHYASATSGRRPSLTAYREARAAVADQADAVRSAFGSRLPDAEARVLDEIDGLDGLRTVVEQSYLPAHRIDPAYRRIVDDLIDGLGLDRQPHLASTATGAVLDSLLRAEAAHSSFETSVFSARSGDTDAPGEFVDAVGYQRLYTSQADRFGRLATAPQRTRFAGIEHNASWHAIAVQYAAARNDPGALEATSPAQARAAFDQALRAYPDFQRQAQSRLDITGSLIDEIAARADDASDAAWWRASWLLVGALLGFVLWLCFSVAIRRSVVRPVQALTGAAVQVAEVAGRELARVADDDADDAGPLRLRAVPVTARDEIGELADAFNQVQDTAAALLERQVLSRRNVAEMFGNVGRRVSNLTTRQLALIDALERGETDPELLDRLYRIDHLAVRLQRNADSLMLLAGIREAGLDADPATLTNVVRAALGQIEGYQRVSLVADTELTVSPDIIADLTLMLAELLENAVAFSPADSPVEVSVHNGPDGALIEITDHGLGMSEERLAEENARLIRRARLDLVPTRVLGLFVVGVLARRWGVGATLSPTAGGGVTSQVRIPAALLLLMSPFPPATGSYGTPAGYGTASADGAEAEDAPTADIGPGGVRRGRGRAGQAGGDGTPAGGEPPGAATGRPAGDRSPVTRAARRADAPQNNGGAARPLRRRVRGATLKAAKTDAAPLAALRAPGLADAEEVRSQIDEFEAAVARAHRDSAGSAAARTTVTEPAITEPGITTSGIAEGAEQ